MKVQWLIICHAVQGTRVQSLVRKLRSQHATEQLKLHAATTEVWALWSPHAVTTEPAHSRVQAPQHMTQ